MLFASSGEGFGLPPREAMATGLPVLLGNSSGLEGICQEEISYWVDPSGYQPATFSAGLAMRNRGSNYFGEIPTYSEIDLAQKMRYIHKNRDEAREKGLQASKWINANQTYDHTSSILIKKLERICST